jgi:8-oxo-dGTP pyrophosphatase MutT (NUDIX family)
VDRIVLVALVTRDGSILLRSRDERSPVRANRWSLPGGGAHPDESPVEAAVRIVEEQTSLRVDPLTLHEAWRGRTPDPLAEVYFYATSAAEVDLPSDPVPGAIPRYKGYELRFIPYDSVLTGRSFTPVTGYLIGAFLTSRLYRALESNSS